MLYFEKLNNLYFIFYICLLIILISSLGLIASKKNLLVSLFCLEMILVSFSLFFISISYYLDDIIGHLIFLILLGLGAADISVALAILVRLHKIKGKVFLQEITKLKG